MMAGGEGLSPIPKTAAPSVTQQHTEADSKTHDLPHDVGRFTGRLIRRAPPRGE